MSRTRQLTTSGSLVCSNSEAEPNTSTPRSIDRKRLVNATRMEGSSSTTNTIGSNLDGSFIIHHWVRQLAKLGQTIDRWPMPCNSAGKELISRPQLIETSQEIRTVGTFE